MAAAPAAATAATGDADQELREALGEENEIIPEDDVIDSDAEGETAKVARDPKMPSEAEVEAHRAAGHWPFRCWCVHCMAARGLGMPHRTPSHGSSEIPVISIDYFFLTPNGCRVPGEDGISRLDLERGVEEGTMAKCLALRDSTRKCVFGWIVPAKGRDEFTVSKIVEVVRWLGFSRLVLKSDNEPSIKALVKDSLAAIRIRCDDIQEVKPEHSFRKLEAGTFWSVTSGKTKS